jgi:hypothetical protein
VAERTLIVRVIGDDRSLQAMAVRDQKAVKNLGTELEVTGGRFTRFNQSLRGGLSGFGGRSSLLFGSGAFLGTAAITAGVKTAIDAASDLNEQITKSEAVFGSASDAVLDWSKTTAGAIGVSQEQALEAAGTFGNLFRSIKLGSDQSSDVSKRLVQLAADLASFNNADPGQVLQDLRSGLVGEAEPLRKYGILLSEARVQQVALKDSGKDSVKQLTDQEKALARIQVIFKDTATAQGDFSRTSEGLANQQRILSAEIKDLEANLGTLLLPAFVKITGALVEVTGAASKAVDGLKAFGNIEIPTIHIPFAFDIPGGTIAGRAGDLFVGLEKNLPFNRLALEIGGFVARQFEEATGSATPELAAKFRDNLGGFLQDALDQATADVPVPKAKAVKGFGTGLTPEDLFGPLITDIPKKLQEQLLDVQIASPGDHDALVKALEKEKNALLNALDDPRLKRDQRIDLKKKLEGVLGSIEGEKTAIKQAVAAADAARSDALRKAADSADAAKRKHVADLERIAEARRETLEKAREILQGRQFRALGLAPSGDEIVPGIKNLKQRIDASLGEIGGGQLKVSSKIADRLRAARKLILKEGADLTKATREKINEFIKAANGAGQTDKLTGPLTKNSVFQANKILEGLGLGPDAERIIRQRVNAFNNADVKLPTFRSRSAGGADSPAGVVVTNINTITLDGDVVARNTTRSQQRARRRNPAQKRGPNRGRF